MPFFRRFGASRLALISSTNIEPQRSYAHAVASDEPIWTEMPADVRATIDFLLDDGFEVVEAMSATMASGMVRLSADLEVTITRDRGQWMFDVDVAGNKLDLGCIIGARSGETSWTPPSTAGELPLQIPDVAWAAEVPTSLDWIRTVPDASERVENVRRLRSRILWSRAKRYGAT